MKHLKYILTMCGYLLMAVACTDREEPVVNPTDGWVISRTAGSGDIRMVGTPKKKGGEPFDKNIIFDDQGNGKWADGQGPTWEEGQVFDLYAIYPVDKPENDIVDASVAYQMQYWSDRMRSSDPNKENRPTEFKLKHLHGQLKVHISVHELSNEEHEPKDVKIRLYQQGRINYPNEKLEPTGILDWTSLTGWQHEDDWSVGNTETEVDHTWVMEKPILIIPQDLILDAKPVVTFHLEDPKYGTAKYEFIPSTPMQLEAGKLTHLYLGITFTKQEPEEDEEEGGEEEAVNPVITVEGITVTDWESGEMTNGTATPI